MITEILNSYGMSLDYARRLVADLSDEQMAVEPTKGMNHPAWIIGHLVYSFQMIGGELGLRPWLSGQWVELFKTGSNPAAADSVYPGKAVLMEALDDGQQRLMSKLIEINDADLGKPLPDKGYRHVFPTLGSAVLHILTVHTATHIGQLSAWRRVMGLTAVSNPV